MAYRQSSGAPIRRGDPFQFERSSTNYGSGFGRNHSRGNASVISELRMSPLMSADGVTELIAKDNDAFEFNTNAEDLSLPKVYESHREDQDMNPTLAMVRRYTDVYDRRIDPDPAVQPVIYYYGMKKQPFFKEVTLLMVYKDDDESDDQEANVGGGGDSAGYINPVANIEKARFIRCRRPSTWWNWRQTQ